MGVTLLTPLAIFKDSQGIFLELNCSGISLDGQNVFHTWGILSITGLIAILSFFSIFMFRHRRKQMSFCIINIILILFLYATIAVYSYFGQEELNITLEGLQYGLVLPVVALIFTVLALIKIKADDKLVRSLDRIR